MPTSQAPRALRIMVYSDDRTVRRAVMTALGTRPDPTLPELELVEVATGPVAEASGLGAFGLRCTSTVANLSDGATADATICVPWRRWPSFS